jgi:hypothetical protein
MAKKKTIVERINWAADRIRELALSLPGTPKEETRRRIRASLNRRRKRLTHLWDKRRAELNDQSPDEAFWKSLLGD